MKAKTLKRILIWTASSLLLLIALLGLHIYLVTKPRVDSHTRVLARIDIHQPINDIGKDKITAWLYQQKAVDHVMCNPKTGIVIFSFSPLQADANKISEKFRADLNYPEAKRFMPTAAQMQSGCPMASNSFSFKAYRFISNIF